MIYLSWVLLILWCVFMPSVLFDDYRKRDAFGCICVVVSIILFVCSLYLFSYDTTVESPKEFKITMVGSYSESRGASNSLKLIGITKEGWLIDETLSTYNTVSTDFTYTQNKVYNVSYRIHRMRFPIMVGFKCVITDVWVK